MEQLLAEAEERAAGKQAGGADAEAVQAAAAAIKPPASFTEKAAPEVQAEFKQRESGASTEFPRAQFTEEMRDAGYTILAPADGAVPLRAARAHLRARRLQRGAAALAWTTVRWTRA